MSEANFPSEDLGAATELINSLPGAAQARLLAGIDVLQRSLALPSRLAPADVS